MGNDPLNRSDPTGLFGNDTSMCGSDFNVGGCSTIIGGGDGGGGGRAPASKGADPLRRFFNDTQEMTLSGADRAALEAAYSQSVQSGNRLAGATGEQYVQSDLRSKGWEVLGGNTQVRDTKGELRVYDVIARSPKGVLTAIEVKTGGAFRSDRQVRIDNSVSQNGGTVVNPIKSAFWGLKGATHFDVQVYRVVLK